MEVPMDVSLLFKESPIEKIDQQRLTRITPQRWPALCKAIDRIGELSAKSQNLRRPLTTYDKILDSDEGQHLYIYWEKPENSPFSIFLGFLKISTKKLYLRDSDGKQFISNPVCILDFYVHETVQNSEIGHKLFEKMLEIEGIENVGKIAMDKPNEALLNFMKKYYQLENPVWQTTNFAVFPTFFEELKAEKSSEDGNGMLPPRGRKAAADRTIENSRNCSPNNRTRHHDGVGNLIHESKIQSPQEKYGPETPRGRKNLRDFGHSNIFG
jgi:hypothetical protein